MDGKLLLYYEDFWMPFITACICTIVGFPKGPLGNHYNEGHDEMILVWDTLNFAEEVPSIYAHFSSRHTALLL